MGKIFLTEKDRQRRQVRARLELTARREKLDAQSLENLANEYDAKTHKHARRYAFRLLALWRAGHLNASIAARGAWLTLEEKTKSLWIDENGQVVTRQIQEQSAEAAKKEKARIKRERQVLGDLCGAVLANGQRCKNKKMFGASRCYRHGGRDEVSANSWCAPIEEGDPFAN